MSSENDISIENEGSKPADSTGPIPSSVSMAGSVGGGSVSEFVVAKDPETKFDSWIDRISDFCSSILVKETRQAIKSRQFFSTFMLLLALVIVWTFFALSPARDSYDVDSLGSFMLCGFLYILGIPLVLIIPYSTFRSLAEEYENGTIEMVLITTMKPWQIIAGKLGSAMLQVLIYLSVLAPCISFCYLLRGVDITQIWYSIGGGFVVTFGLCCLAIALASAADTSRVVQVLSVLLILGLLFCAAMWCGIAYGICFNPVPAGQQDMVNLLISGPILAWISIAIILFFAASAKIAFASSNRSTMIRVGVTAQVIIFVGYVLATGATFGFHKYMFMFASVFAMQYLLLVGTMMVACHSGMSPRVRRSLPISFVNRSLFSLYMPGPGRAFLFTIGLALGLSLALTMFAVGHSVFNVSFDVDTSMMGGSSNAFSGVDIELSVTAIATNFVFFLFYFTIVFLVSRFFAWRAKSRKPFVVELALIPAVLVFLATVGSYAIAPNIYNNYGSGFEFSQIFNWYRVQYLAGSFGISGVGVNLIIILCPTLLLLLICCFFAAPELAESSLDVPDRILEENEELKRERIWGSEADEETIDEIFAAVRPDVE